MNKKIKNYVEVLFSDVPSTRKARELKEEILSNMNDHFEAHLAEGMSENQAYTESIKDLGDVDELLNDFIPEEKQKEPVDDFRRKRARNVAVSVMLYFLGIILVAAIPGFTALSDEDGNVAAAGLAGTVLMFICWAFATGLLIYTGINRPHSDKEYSGNGSAGKKHTGKRHYGNDVLDAVMNVYWLIVLIIYLAVSFVTHAWYITWMIFLIGVAVNKFINALCASGEIYE